MPWNPFADTTTPDHSVELLLTIPESDFVDKVIKQFRNNFKKVVFYDRTEDGTPTPAVTGMDYYIYRKVWIDPKSQTSSPIIAYQVFAELSRVNVILRVTEKHFDGSSRNFSGRNWPVYDTPVEFVFLEGSQYFTEFHKLYDEIEVLQKQQADLRRDNIIEDFLKVDEIVFDNPIEKVIKMQNEEEKSSSAAGSKFGSNEPEIMDFSGEV